VKVCLRLFLVSLHGSEEDGAEIGRGCGCGRTLGHGDKLVVAGNSEGDREGVER
jgi:hypothetical protein